jgi:hypothetical protein
LRMVFAKFDARVPEQNVRCDCGQERASRVDEIFSALR